MLKSKTKVSHFLDLHSKSLLSVPFFFPLSACFNILFSVLHSWICFWSPNWNHFYAILFFSMSPLHCILSFLNYYLAHPAFRLIPSYSSPLASSIQNCFPDGGQNGLPSGAAGGERHGEEHSETVTAPFHRQGAKEEADRAREDSVKEKVCERERGREGEQERVSRRIRAKQERGRERKWERERLVRSSQLTSLAGWSAHCWRMSCLHTRLGNGSLWQAGEQGTWM